MTNDDKLKFTLKFKSKLLFPADNIGTVRTGKEWFNRYAIFPWEHPRDFEQV